MTLRTTRDGWHRVAEHVLAAGQYADTGEIKLAIVDGGFRTTRPLRGNRRLRVTGTRLVIADDAGTRAVPLTTVAAAARFAGITPGLPATVYQPATPLAPDEPLDVDAESARVLGDWYQLAQSALLRFSADLGSDGNPILWPEHFDVGITIQAVNFGASPGDDHIPQPYAYVGPHGGPPTRDAFWNTRFGAARTIGEVPTVDAAARFFHEGRSRLAEHAPTG